MVMLENQEFILSSGQKVGFSRQIAMFVLTKTFSLEKFSNSKSWIFSSNYNVVLLSQEKLFLINFL